MKHKKNTTITNKYSHDFDPLPFLKGEGFY